MPAPSSSPLHPLSEQHPTTVQVRQTLAATAAPRPPRFMHPVAFKARLDFLLRHARLMELWPLLEDCPLPELSITDLFEHPEHGSITAITGAILNGRTMVGVSFNGSNPRFFSPLDYCALSTATAFGPHITLQKTGTGFAYPRIRATTPEDGHGLNIYLTRIIADAGPWQIVDNLEALAELNEKSGCLALDYHYFGRDALRLKPVQEVWEEGKKARVPRLGRKDLLSSSLHYYDLNATKADIPVSRDDYQRMVELAFGLADHWYGKVAKAPRGALT